MPSRVVPSGRPWPVPSYRRASPQSSRVTSAKPVLLDRMPISGGLDAIPQEKSFGYDSKKAERAESFAMNRLRFRLAAAVAGEAWRRSLCADSRPRPFHKSDQFIGKLRLLWQRAFGGSNYRRERLALRPGFLQGSVRKLTDERDELVACRSAGLGSRRFRISL
jgi:hypothetical protein